VPKMPYIDAAIRKHQLRGGRTLFSALVTAASPAQRVPNGDGGRVEQRLNDKFRPVVSFDLRLHALDVEVYGSLAAERLGTLGESALFDYRAGERECSIAKERCSGASALRKLSGLKAWPAVTTPLEVANPLTTRSAASTTIGAVIA